VDRYDEAGDIAIGRLRWRIAVVVVLRAGGVTFAPMLGGLGASPSVRSAGGVRFGFVSDVMCGCGPRLWRSPPVAWVG